MKDKLNITIRLAGRPPLPLSVEREKEELYRKAEYYVNSLWEKRSGQFAGKTSEDVLAMVAFEFATLYLAMEKNEELLEQLDSDLGRLLHRMPG